MKPQDLIFLLVFIFLLVYKRAHYTWHAAILCLLSSAGLFLIGNLYTAQRLTWYAAAFMLIYCVKLSIGLLKK